VQVVTKVVAKFAVIEKLGLFLLRKLSCNNPPPNNYLPIFPFSILGVSFQAFCDLEPIYTYEGTYDINSLVTGREVTGIASFKPAVSSRRSRL